MDERAAKITPQQDLMAGLLIFLDELRVAGYNIGAGQYIAVEEFLLKLAATGNVPQDPRRLGSMLSALLCNSQREQEDFSVRFAYWTSRFVPEPRADLSAEEKSEKVVEAEDEIQSLAAGSRRWTWVIALCAVLLVGVVAYFVFNLGLSGFSSGQEGSLSKQPDPTDPSLWSVLLLLFKVFPNSSLILFFLAGAGIAAWLLRWLWWQHRAHLYLARRQTSEEPEARRFFVKGLKYELFRSVSFFRLAQQFHKRMRVASGSLDIDATIKASVDLGGVYTEVEGFKKIIPEYLILIDRTTYLDHQALYIDSVIDKLDENSLYVKRFYFDKDARNCSPSGKEELDSINLKELASRYPYHRLIIFSDVIHFFDQFSGEIVKWIKQFSAWQSRSILTFELISQHLYYKRKLENSGFMVLPASQAGMAAFIAKTNLKSFEPALPEEREERFPDILRGYSAIWIDRHEPDHEQIELALADLRSYLGANGYDWVSACAVYPEINWNLTLFLGYNLTDEEEKPIFDARTLAGLSRLPWFRYGRMPDWLRGRLIENLPAKKEKKIRKILFDLLGKATDQPLDGVHLEYAKEHQNIFSKLSKRIFKVLSKEAHPHSPLSDYVFATFMQNKLAVRIPKAVQKVFQRDRAAQPFRFLRTKTAFEKTVAGTVFKTPELSDYLLMAFLVPLAAVAAVSRIYFEGVFGLDFSPIQVLVTFLLGYRYGKIYGAFCGLLIFLPNLVLYFWAIPEFLIRYIIFYTIKTDLFRIKSFSPIAYILYGFIGYFSAVLREKLSLLNIKSSFVDSDKESLAKRKYFLLLLLAYACSFEINFGPTRITLQPVIILILFLVAFRFGTWESFKFIFGCSLILIGGLFLDNFYLGQIFSPAQLFWLMTMLTIAGHLNFAPKDEGTDYAWDLYAFFFLIGFFLSFKIQPAEHIIIKSFPVSLALVILAGYLFGPKRGFQFGLIWGLYSSIPLFMPAELVTIWGTDRFAVLIAPILGYVGGVGEFSNRKFLRRAVLLFAGIYLFQFVMTMMSGSYRLAYYLYLPINFILSLFALLFFYAVFGRFRNRPTGRLAQIEAGPIFVKPTRFNYVMVGLAVFLGIIYWAAALNADNYRFDLSVVQVLIVFLLGYRCGKVFGAVCGLLIFLPNVSLYYLFGQEFAEKTIFYFIDFSGKEAFGVIAYYILYGSVGWLSAVLKEKLNLYQDKFLFIDSKRKYLSQTILFALIPIYLNSFLFRISDMVGIYPRIIVPVILILISIYYGFRKALICLFWMIPILISSIQYGPAAFGLGYSKAQLFWILTAVMIAGNLNITVWDVKIRYSKTFFVIFLCLSCLFSFRLVIGENYPVPDFSFGYSIFGYPIALSIILLSGYFLGSLRGLWIGLLWGIFNIIHLLASPSLTLVYPEWFALLAAPLLGYIGGSDLVDRIGFWRSAIYIFIYLYSCLLLNTLMVGSTKIYSYLNHILSLFQSLFGYMFFYLIFNLFFKGRKVAREIAMKEEHLKVAREPNWAIYVMLPWIITVSITFIAIVFD